MTDQHTENQAVIDLMERHTPLQELEPGKIYLIQDTDGHRRIIDTCRIAFNATPEWAAWNQINDHLMSQGEFAEFVEQWVDTIVKPDGATMLEIAQSLRANVGVTFKSQKRLANGQTQFEYTENVDASAGTAGDITIPDDMELVVCPFYGAKVYKVRAKFRYRVNSGKLSMGVRLLNTEKVVDAVLSDVESVIREGLPDVTVLHGE